MKKLLLSLTFLLFVSGIYVNEAKAQLRPEFGIRVGVNFASIIGFPTLTEDSPRIGFVGGVYAVIPIPGSAFSMQPEILYTQKGIEFPDEVVNLSYIQIPLFARIDFASDSLLSPHLLFGPYVAFNLTAEEEGPDPSISKTVFGLSVGAGIDINSLSIGLRYSADISKTFAGPVEGRNSVGSIVVGYQF